MNINQIIDDFITNRIVEEEGSKIKRKKELVYEFKYCVINVHGIKPQRADYRRLFDAMNNKFGEYNISWNNVKLIYDEDIEVEEE